MTSSVDGFFGQFGGIIRVSAEIGLETVSVVETVGQSAKVGNVDRLVGGVAHIALRRVEEVIYIAEVRLVGLQDIIVLNADAGIVRIVLDIGHTGHDT